MKRPRSSAIGVVTASGIATALSKLSAHSFVLAPQAPSPPPHRRRRLLTLLHQSSVSFSDLARDYETRVEPVTTMFLEEMIEPFTFEAGDNRLLDVGCGCGGGALHAAKAGFAVTAIDNSPAFIGRLSQRCDEQQEDESLSIRVQVADGQSMPTEFTSEFDFVVSSFALVFFPDPLAGLQEMHRCLVPGGRVAISGWGDRGDSPAFRIIPDAVRATAPELISASSKKKPFLRTPEEVVTLMEQAGFVDIEIKSDIKRTLAISTAQEYFERFAMGSPPTRSMMVWMRDNMGEDTVTKFKDEVMKLAVERGSGKPNGPIEIVSPAYIVYGSTKKKET